MKPRAFSQAFLRKTTLNLLAAAALWAGTERVCGQAVLDNFSPSANGNVWTAAVQTDGKIIVGGEFTSINGIPRQRIARLNADGSLDASFDPGANGWVLRLLVQQDGKIVAAGGFTRLGGGGSGLVDRDYIGRLNPDGSLDHGFDPAPDDWVWSLALDHQGRILLGGRFTELAGMTRHRLGRLNTNGSLDVQFNPGANDQVNNLVAQRDGKILAGGFFTALGGGTGTTPRNHLGRLNDNGTIDSQFSSDANDAVFCLALQPDDRILVGGQFTTLGGRSHSGLGRLNADGSLDNSFSADVANPGLVDGLALQPDGKIMVGGNFNRLGNVNHNHLGRLNSDGSVDRGFSLGANSNIYELVTQPNGKVLVMGRFTTLGGQPYNRIARVDFEDNDDFANAVRIVGTTSTMSGANLDATKEPDEPNHAGDVGGASVWWNWTAPVNSRVTIDTLGSSFDTLLAVYTGSSVSRLTLVAKDDDSAGGVLSRAGFLASAGTEYHIAVDGYNAAAGVVLLNLEASPLPIPPANDAFANRTGLSGANVSVTAHNIGATLELNEPAHAFSGGASVWWTWTAPTDLVVSLDTLGSSFDAVVALYAGTSLATLVNHGGSFFGSRFSVHVAAGSSYQIAVDGQDQATGDIVLNLLTRPPFDNDGFASRFPIVGLNQTVTGNNTRASREPGEPDHAQASGAGSVWWTWTAPANLAVTLDTAGSSLEFGAAVAVYTGRSVSALSEVASARLGLVSGKLSFYAEAGQEYQIAVDGPRGGSIQLHLSGEPPAWNDVFSDRYLVPGLAGVLTTTNELATLQAGEPEHWFSQGGGRSVWWRWTAPANLAMLLDTTGSSVSTLVAVYTGTSVDSLNLVARSFNSRLSFVAQAGVEYAIVVDSESSFGGMVVLDYLSQPPAFNNHFVDRSLIQGLNATLIGNDFSATSELFEPWHAGVPPQKSIWWKWTAPANRAVTVRATTGSFATSLAVYTGATLSGLSEVVSRRSQLFGSLSVAFEATAGTEYQIAVDGSGGFLGKVVLDLLTQAPTINDNFGDRLPIGGLTNTVVGHNIGASKQTGEPDHADNGGGRSVWWRWTAPTDLTVLLSTASNTFDTTLAVYTGSSVGSLTPVAANDDSGNSQASAVEFSAQVGRQYQFAVDGFDGASGNYTLALRAYSLVGNDDFADRSPISGLAQTLSGHNVGASQEAGEPNHGGLTGGRSVWWKWTAPMNLAVTLDPAGSSIARFSSPSTVLAVYTGQSVGNLTEVSASTFGRSLHFRATAGTEYQIAVDGDGGATGTIQLRLSTQPLAGNDAFADRYQIIGANSLVPGHNIGATKEPGEPNHANDAGGSSVWWSWTAPENLVVTLGVSNSFNQALLAVYSGSVVSSLSLVANSSFSPTLSYYARAGTEYQIAIDRSQGAGGPFVLRLEGSPPTQAPAPNDYPAEAIELVGVGGHVEGSNFYATTETDLPGSRGSSVWWRWTAPSDGRVVVEKIDGGWATESKSGVRLNVYTGAPPASLARIATDTFSAGVPASLVEFPVSAGQTYHLQAEGTPEAFFSFDFTFHARPSNDDFAFRIRLDPAVEATVGTTIGATQEPEESSYDHGTATVWWAWTPSQTGPVLLTTLGSQFNSVLAVYAGSVIGDLSLIAKGSSAALSSSATGPRFDPSSRVQFNAVAGKTYQIVVGVDSGEPGTVTLNFERLFIAELSSVQRTVRPDLAVDFTATLLLANRQSQPSGPLRLRLVARAGVTYREGLYSFPRQDRPSFDVAELALGVFSVPPPGSINAQGSALVTVSGTCPAPVELDDWGYGWGIVTRLEEQIGGVWTLRDARPILIGEWPIVNGFGGPGGGVITITFAFGTVAACTPSLDVVLGPAWAIPLGAAWRISPTDHGGMPDYLRNWQTAPALNIELMSTNFTIELRDVPWLIAPIDRAVQITGCLNRLDLTYAAAPFRFWIETSDRLFIEGAPTFRYAIECSPTLTPTDWTEVLTGVLMSGPNEIVVAPTSATAFYRARFRAPD